MAQRKDIRLRPAAGQPGDPHAAADGAAWQDVTLRAGITGYDVTLTPGGSLVDPPAAGGPGGVSGAAALAGSGVLSANAVRETFAAAALTGLGSLTASGALAVTAAASLTGTGTAAATAVRTVTAAASLTGAGTTAAAGVRDITGASALSGAGVLSASGDVAASTPPQTTHVPGYMWIPDTFPPEWESEEDEALALILTLT